MKSVEKILIIGLFLTFCYFLVRLTSGKFEKIRGKLSLWPPSFSFEATGNHFLRNLYGKTLFLKRP